MDNFTSSMLKTLLLGLGCGAIVVYISSIIADYVEPGANRYLVLNFGLGFLGGVIIDLGSALRSLNQSRKQKNE